MKKILFPLAFSANAKQNFLYALDWAKKFDATLVVMHALGISKVDKSGVNDWNELGSEIMNKMMEFVEENQTRKFQAVNIEYTVQIGFPVNAIELVIEEEEIDMVVMGMRTHPTALEAYFSSVAMELISRVSIPVLLIPDSNKFEEIKNMTYTFNFDFKELVVIHKLLVWCKKTKTALNCLHVLEADEELDVKEFEILTIKEIFKQNKNFGEMIKFDMTCGKFEEIIDFLTTEKEMDLLVMLSHKRNFKTRFMEPSTASKVTRKMNIPVLILKEEYIFTPQKGGKLKYSV